MGFLDHSTNNIIVDAVLTDLGRQALARNDGSFNIFQFALADDEIDYTVIKQFGRTVGKEKVEKNTPIIEALTAGSVGLKNRLLSVSNEFLTHLPVLEMSLGTSTTESTNTQLVFSRQANETRNSLTVTISSKTGVGIENDLQDGELRIEMNHLFLQLSSGEPPEIIHTDNIAVYRFGANFSGNTETISSSFTLQLKNFSNTTFTTYSTSGGNFIKTFVKVTGINSGLSKSIEVRINK
jgi:hypothetical protein